MSQIEPRYTLPPRPEPADVDNVLASRLLAYCMDFLIIFFLILFTGFFVLILGVITFGLAWWFFAILGPAVAIAYSALTIGGDRQATIGMRFAGLKVIKVAPHEGKPDELTAAVHALLFYVAAGTFLLWLIDIIFGLLRPDRRLLHDVLTGLMVVRA